ncbi:uncharacterized protein LOC126828707 [Patella vulgata]|uniref:uncharacterized protein LOC126828707 n=1 Tax=Patella vulgata TaxID=6465 RepID=UPI00217F432E|nr:uncharacterized protein LOC126828707 [Patella vulgata]
MKLKKDAKHRLVFIACVCLVIIMTMPTRFHIPSFIHVNIKSSRDVKEEGRVYGLDTNCKAYFNATKLSNMKRLLGMKTTPEVEEYLFRFGFPSRTTTSGDVYIPDLPDPTIPIPDTPAIVFGISSNHFDEAKASLYSLDTILRPAYPDIKVIIYDIGLNETERQAVRRYGKCELRTFEFDKYPEHIKVLHLCAWKPIIIQEVLNQYGFVMYMDASGRIRSSRFTPTFNFVKETGVIFRSVEHLPFFLVNHTFPKTFEYFQEKPCLFHKIKEAGATFGLVVKNNLYSYAIMRSWLTCALQRYCIMPEGTEQRLRCPFDVFKYHKCHREDQSALGIAISMIYHYPEPQPYLAEEIYYINRDKKSDYF